MLAYAILFISPNIDLSQSLMQKINLPDDISIHYTDSGIGALSALNEFPIKLLIVHKDLSHRMNGVEVCELLLKNEKTADVPIIFLSDEIEAIPQCTNIIKFLSTDPDPKTVEKHILRHYHSCEHQYKIQIEKNLVLSIVNRIHSPIFIIDHNHISFANQYFLNFFDVPDLETFHQDYPRLQELFISEKPLHTIEPISSFSQWIKEVLQQTDEEQNFLIRNKYENEIHVKIRGEFLEHSNEFLIITQDITSEVKHAKEIVDLYNYDQLTKLPNRKKLIKDIVKYDEISLAIIDVDEFKVINDFYGHVIGDFIISEVGKRISHYIMHESLILYRLPSDSFAILNKEHIEKEYFEIIIISLIQIIAKNPFVYEQKNEENIEIYANVSAGLVFEKESALAHADMALREAKRTHKDYLIYDESIQQEKVYKNNMEWIHKIKIAIANNKIVPYFQPIVDNQTQKIVKYECLVRLIDEENQVISPYFFLEIAKQAKLYEAITKLMIKRSFQTFVNAPYEFSINLSIEDITDYNLFGYIKSMLGIYPLADRVCFEILETEKIEDYQVISNFVNEVRALGCKVSIDDFGSGYSNFSHLLNLKFDYLKIDASLIKNIHEDKHKQIIVKTIVTFAQQLGIKTIGEFVESEAIYDYIKELGITYSQGYYFSPPVETIS